MGFFTSVPISHPNITNDEKVHPPTFSFSAVLWYVILSIAQSRPDNKCCLWPQIDLMCFPCCDIARSPPWAPQLPTDLVRIGAVPYLPITCSSGAAEHQPRVGRAALAEHWGLAELSSKPSIKYFSTWAILCPKFTPKLLFECHDKLLGSFCKWKERSGREKRPQFTMADLEISARCWWQKLLYPFPTILPRYIMTAGVCAL